MTQIIGAMIALGVLVAVHEGGHFLAARWLGVVVEKFSIGFGPKLLSFKGKNTEYRISLIPLGGYVKMKGENPDDVAVEEKGSFLSLVWWKKGIIAFAGPFTNLLFALLLLIITYGLGKSYEDFSPVIGKIATPAEASQSYDLGFLEADDELVRINGKEITSWSTSYEASNGGIKNIAVKRDGQEHEFEVDISQIEWFSRVLPKTTTIIGEVSVGMPAYNAGLQSGDKVLSINEEKVADWYELREAVQSTEGNTVTLKIERDGGTFSKVIPLQENLLDGNSIIGITQQLPEKIEEKYSFWESIQYGTLSTIDIVLLNYAGLYKLILKPAELKNNIGGPVMMYTMSKQTIKRGWNSILSFVALISVILMVMNLLPIPVLDGGMIMFCLIEGIRRKALSLHTQAVLQRIGAVLLITLMFFAFSNDFIRIFKRNASINSQQKEILENRN